jgi:uncharacterized membrane protein YhaH (DUF805 family)
MKGMEEAEMKVAAGGDDGTGSRVPPIGFLEAWKRSWVWWTWEGRATRREYVFQRCILWAAWGVFLGLLSWANATGDAVFLRWCGRVYALYGLAKMFPAMGVTVRRLHDVGFSGWWYWLYAIPFGGIVLEIGLLFHPGERGPNEYGLDPRLPQKPWRGLSSLP